MGNAAAILYTNLSNVFNKRLQVVMIGLDGAGKTTILYRLKHNKEARSTVPTTAFNVETISPHKNLKLLLWDTAGTDITRPLWKTYCRKADGIIFVVDSTDLKRLEEAKIELEEVLNIKGSFGTLLLILANKQDLRQSVSPIELAQKLELDYLDGSVNWHMHPTSGRYGDGLQESMLQFAAMIRRNRKIGARNRKLGDRSWSDECVGGNRGFSSTKYSKFV